MGENNCDDESDSREVRMEDFDDETHNGIGRTRNGNGGSLPSYPIVTPGASGDFHSENTQHQHSLKTNTLKSYSETLKRGTLRFFGIDDEDDDEIRTKDAVDGKPEEEVERVTNSQEMMNEQERLWNDRRLRLAYRRYGGFKQDSDQYLSSYIQDAGRSIELTPTNYDDLDNEESPDTRTFPYVRRKPHIGQYAIDGLTTIHRKLTLKRPIKDESASPKSKSYGWNSVSEHTNDRQVPKDDLGPSQELESFFSKGRVETDGSLISNQRTEDKHDGPYDGTVPVGLRRLDHRHIQSMEDNSDRRKYGVGVVGNVLGRRRKRITDTKLKEEMDEMDDYRPYFTYWVTFVQVVIMIFSLIVYGIGNFDVFLSDKIGLVLTKGLTLEQVRVREPGNFWIGPRPADLIRLGAKFTPCMRRDEPVLREIEKDRDIENKLSGCCVRNDHSGCVQSLPEHCSSLLSTFHKWNDDPGSAPESRQYGPVCGQDPRYCKNPLSNGANIWPDDLKKWPICHQTSIQDPIGMPDHMTCEVIARPCCIGIHGKCELHTAEYCNWIQGHFHPEATLCSQVSCMGDICGMLPFFSSPESPDQIYRLISSLFLHAGLLHCSITLIIQFFFMRDLEKLCGPFRLAIIYFGSGIVGNLASAIFTPYRAESGPAGAQFGLLACHIIEVVNAWSLLRRPILALGKLIFVTLGLFILGFLPWVDNYAHIFGFIQGLLLSYSFMPYISYRRNKQRRKILIILCLLLSLVIFVTLLVLFYIVPIHDCEICKYLSCIPFTPDFCAVQNINLVRDKPILK